MMFNIPNNQFELDWTFRKKDIKILSGGQFSEMTDFVIFRKFIKIEFLESNLMKWAVTFRVL